MADVKISGLPASTTPLAGTEVLPIVQGGVTKQVSVDNLTTGKAVSVAGLTNTSNLTFTGTGNRIAGDFSGATIANRTSFQDSGTDKPTVVQAIPSGTGTTAGWLATNNSNPTDASTISLTAQATQIAVAASRLGTGTFLPLVLQTNGSTTMRLHVSQGVSIGTGTDPGANNLFVNGTVRTQGYTVATLPAAGVAGRKAYVTDATLPTYLGALVGGGAVSCPVFDNGTAWVSA
jgi:hypothetical protein